jgi:branched-chain amino acid transport system ATP-binding protein
MTILHGTSFSVARGAITTVIGPNGAGKSTVFKTVFGMLPARSGGIVFEGADITNLTPRELLARGISYVPQGRNIFPELSVRHNLEFGAVMAPKGFDLAGRMDAAMDRFPVLHRKAGQQASTLSGGEQKMLEIARALLLEPKLMMIDEPSIGLSPILVNELFATLTGMRDARHHGADDRAERQARAGDLRPRHRAGARPHPHRRRREGDPRRSAHRAICSWVGGWTATPPDKK